MNATQVIAQMNTIYQGAQRPEEKLNQCIDLLHQHWATLIHTKATSNSYDLQTLGVFAIAPQKQDTISNKIKAAKINTSQRRPNNSKSQFQKSWIRILN